MEKYFAQFKGRNGHLYRWSVKDETYSGSAKELSLSASGIVIQEDNAEEPYTPIRTWNGYAYIVDDGLAEGLIAKSAHSLPTEIIEEDRNVVVWRGYISTEVRSTQYPTMMTEMAIPLQGRIATAGGYNCAKEPKGNVSLGHLFHEALHLCGVEDTAKLLWPDDCYTPDVDGASGVHLLAMTVSHSRFYVDPQKETIEGDEPETIEAETAQVVIEEIMKLFGFTLYERGDGLQAISKGATQYRSIPVGDLPVITPSTDATKYEVKTVANFALGDLETEEQYSYQQQGRKGVSIEVDMDRGAAQSLPGLGVDQFGYLGTYNRWDSIIYQQHRRMYLHVVAHLNQSDNVKTYVYNKSGVGWKEADISSWLDEDGKLRDSIYTASYPRTGMYPASIAKYLQSEYEDGTLKNYDYVDGYMFNPCVDEVGDPPILEDYYPLLRIYDPRGINFKGGSFVINFLMTGFSGFNFFPDMESPVNHRARLYMCLRVGDYWWTGTEWEKSGIARRKFEVPMEDKETEVLGYKSCGPIDQKTIEMPYNNVAGYFAQLKDSQGNPLEISGDVEITLYIYTAEFERGKNKARYYGIFLSDLSIEYHLPDDDKVRETSGPKNDKRILYKKTTGGFDLPEETVPLMLGSYAYDSGAALCTLSYAGKSIKYLRRPSDMKKLPPEEFLLGNLFSYYDRIVERRELVVGQTDQPSSADAVSMDGKQWRQVAISENYGQGTRQITIEDA